MSVCKSIMWYAVLLVGVASCQQETFDTAVEKSFAGNVAAEEYVGEVLDATFRIAIPQYAKVEDAQVCSASRSLMEDGERRLHFDYRNMKEVLIHVCLQNGDDVHSRSYATLEGQIVENGDGTFAVQIANPYVRLKEGRLEGNEWKVCALMETTERAENQRFFSLNRYTGIVNTNLYFAADGNFMSKDLTKLTTPLYSCYAAVLMENGKAVLNLNFEPLGTIIRMNVQNSLAIPIYINKVKVRNPYIKSGIASVTLGEEENGILKFHFASQEQPAAADGVLWPQNEVCTWNVNAARVDTNDFIYLWCIPVSAASAQSQIELVYSTGNSGAALDPDSIMLDKLSNVLQLQSGFYYSVDAPLKESDLMITEMLHHNPSGYNFSVIEIYNPTSREIDIRNYGLCRVLKWEGIYPLVIGESSANVQPIEKALVQDLFVTDFNQPMYRFDGQLAASSYQGKNRYYDMYGTHINKDARRYMLQPGHTVVLVAGQIRERLAKGYLREQYYWPTGSLMYNTPYLANAVQSGYCQYVAAVDNGIKEIDYASGANSGVMQHGFNHVMVLVKKREGATGYEAVDWLFSACYPDIVSLLQTRALPAPNVSDDHLFIARKESVMYPVSKRDNTMYLHASKSHLPAGNPIYDTSQTYQFYDWMYHFTQQPREYYSDMYLYMTPGTRSFVPEVNNGMVWMPGAYNETGNNSTPNSTTGQ